MTRDEIAARLAVITEMLTVFGQRANRDRILGLARITQHIPLPLLRGATRRAACLAVDYPPVPGAIVQAALDLSAAWGMHDPRGRRPAWYRRTLQERPREVAQQPSDGARAPTPLHAAVHKAAEGGGRR